MKTSNRNWPTMISSVMKGIRLSMYTLFATLSLASQAQSTPSTPSDSKMPQVQQYSPNGWIFFDDRVGKDLGLQQDELSDLRSMDDMYRDKYFAFGETPWTAKGYKELTDEREQRVRGMLTPAQYEQWTKRYGSTRYAQPTPGTSAPLPPVTK